MKSAIALFVLVAALGVGAWWFFIKNHAQDRAFDGREIATRALAEHVASKFPSGRVLIVSNPFVTRGTGSEIIRMEEAGIAGIKEGLGSKLEAKTVYPELTPEAQANPHGIILTNETTTPLSFLVAQDAFDKIAASHPECDVMISLIGLPANVREVECWRNEGKPSFALLLPDLRVIGNAAEVRRNMKRGKLVAFVANKPGADIRGKEKLRFESQFLRTYTAENIDQTIATYPQLFVQRQ